MIVSDAIFIMALKLLIYTTPSDGYIDVGEGCWTPAVGDKMLVTVLAILVTNI